MLFPETEVRSLKRVGPMEDVGQSHIGGRGRRPMENKHQKQRCKQCATDAEFCAEVAMSCCDCAYSGRTLS